MSLWRPYLTEALNRYGMRHCSFVYESAFKFDPVDCLKFKEFACRSIPNARADLQTIHGHSDSGDSIPIS